MRIEGYEFGRIVIDGREYVSDLIIYPDRIDPSWWRQVGHRLDPGDLPHVLACPPDVLVIGTGTSGRMSVPSEVLELFRARGVDVRIARTSEAVREYNRLQGVGKSVVAALHLTC